MGQDLSLAEAVGGSFADAIRHLEESISAGPGKFAPIEQEATLAMLYARSGDLDAARRSLRMMGLRITNPGGDKAPGQVYLIEQRHRKSVPQATAVILDASGRYEEAEFAYRSSLRLAEDFVQRFAPQGSQRYLPPGYYDRWHYEKDSMRSGLAMLLLRQGRLIEGEIEARKALSDTLRRLGRYSPESATMLRTLATIIGEQGRHAEAENLARLVLDIYEKIGAPGDSFELAKAYHQLAQTLVSQGRWKASLVVFDEIKTGLANDPEIFEKNFGADLGWSLALLVSDRTAEAKSIAETALQQNLTNLGEKHYRTALARGVLAMSMAKLDEPKKALAGFTEALPVLLSRSRSSDDETTSLTAREQRLGLILESYIGLLADIRGTDVERGAGIDAAREAFRIADVAQARSVQRALVASAARAAAGDPELADLVRREQDASKQAAALYGLLANARSVPTDQQNQAAIQSLQTQIDRLRAARTALTEEIEARFPEYAELINPKPATVEDARSSLSRGEALIATYVGRERTFIWAVPQTGPVAFAAADIGRGELADGVAELRAALEPNVRTLGDIPAFDFAKAYGLYRALLEPVEAGWKEARNLLVVAHGPLGYLPLALLPTEPAEIGGEGEPLFSDYRSVPWLIRSHGVTVLPSVASLRTLRGLPPGDATRKAFVGFGDPYFSQEQAGRSESEEKGLVNSPLTKFLLDAERAV